MVIAMNEQERAEYVREVLDSARDTLNRTVSTDDEQNHAQPVVKRKDIQAGRLHYRRSEPVHQPEPDPSWDDWNNWCDDRIRSIVQQHQNTIVEAAGEVIGMERKRTRDVVQKAMDDVTAECRKRISKCRTQMAEFRGQLHKLSDEFRAECENVVAILRAEFEHKNIMVGNIIDRAQAAIDKALVAERHQAKLERELDLEKLRTEFVELRTKLEALTIAVQWK
jgi:hypothetical protein